MPQNRKTRWWLLAILSVAALVRIPGLFWGANFPGGWQAHHIDEYTHWVVAERMVVPGQAARWTHLYPKGMAAHAAVPLIAARVATGSVRAPAPPMSTIVTMGRLASLLYGVATVLVVFLWSRRLFTDIRVALIGAGILALGGLHVTQSHFFLSDVPAMFWLLLGLYCLHREWEAEGEPVPWFLAAASFCFGVAFGIKLVIAGLPSLTLIALRAAPRLYRAALAGAFFLSGFFLVNLGLYSSADLFRMVAGGMADDYVYDRAFGALLYLIEIPGVASFPVCLLGAVGLGLLARNLWNPARRTRLPLVLVVIVLPLLILLWSLLFKLDHFPRHLLPFLPFLAMAAAYALTCLSCPRTFAAAAAALFAYLLVFVYDGERVFVYEPRNQAASWIQAHAPPGNTLWWRGHQLRDYPSIEFPRGGQPSYIVIEMHSANHYLSGMNWRDSYPRDKRHIFDAGSLSHEDIRQLQGLFRNSSPYSEAARFSEGYFMPEYTWPNRLIGDRSRNYVTEVVIFQKSRDDRPPRPESDDDAARRLRPGASMP